MVAVDLVLSGHPVEDAAARAVVTPKAVQQWLGFITYVGIDVALSDAPNGFKGSVGMCLSRSTPLTSRAAAARISPMPKPPPRLPGQRRVSAMITMPRCPASVEGCALL
jgi:hypothetical protein